jgi:hypothetical protein
MYFSEPINPEPLNLYDYVSNEKFQRNAVLARSAAPDKILFR